MQSIKFRGNSIIRYWNFFWSSSFTKLVVLLLRHFSRLSSWFKNLLRFGLRSDISLFKYFLIFPGILLSSNWIRKYLSTWDAVIFLNKLLVTALVKTFDEFCIKLKFANQVLGFPPYFVWYSQSQKFTYNP